MMPIDDDHQHLPFPHIGQGANNTVNTAYRLPLKLLKKAIPFRVTN
jgi:hypothetical protein